MTYLHAVDIWALILKIIEQFLSSSGNLILLSDCKAMYNFHKQVKTAG